MTPCIRLETESVVGLENEQVALAFDKRTGALVSLRNRATHDEYLKTPGRDGNPFRCYLDTTELPRLLRGGVECPVQNPDDALGGTLLQPADCALTEESFRRENNGGTLRLAMAAGQEKIVFTLEVFLPDSDSTVLLRLSARNDGPATRHLMMAVPYLAGLSLGQNRATNLGVRLIEFGQSRGPAWQNAGDIYGRLWASQWDAVYEPALNECLGVVVSDRDLRNKMFQRHAGGIMSVLYFDNLELAPGSAVHYPTTELLICKGGWKAAAHRYGQWFRSAFSLRQQPQWVDEVGLFMGPWIPNPKRVAESKRQPDAKDSFTSFAQLPRLYHGTVSDGFSKGGHHELKEWAFYWQGLVRQESSYSPYAHVDAIYDLREDLGGPAAFREGQAKVERIGRFVGLYVASKSLRTDSLFFNEPYAGAGTQPQDWQWLDVPGESSLANVPSMKGKPVILACDRYTAWQDHIAQTCKRLLRETGARYIRLDEFAAIFEPCHNPAHKHSSPFASIPDQLEFLRKVRAAMDEVDPEALLFTEGTTDALAISCNGTLAMWGPGPDIAPLRLVLPDYLGFSYHLGQVDCALNGHVCATEYACNKAGWWTEWHGTQYSPGLEYAPKSYPVMEKQDLASGNQEGWTGVKLQWHVLGYTFAAAVRHGCPTDVNPVGIGQDPQEWAARLWRSDQYWLMVCGNRAALRPANEVRVRLPELPEAVQHAFEFDVETLVMREVTITRDATGIYVNVASGFAAVFFPLPHCPALVQMRPLSSTDATAETELTALAPWRTNGGHIRVQVQAPGLNTEPGELLLPGRATLSVPRDTEEGSYYVKISGNDCLPMKRWLDVSKAADSCRGGVVVSQI